MKDGKLVEGEAPIRETVDFSNWYAGNVDPEDLKRYIYNFWISFNFTV